MKTQATKPNFTSSLKWKQMIIVIVGLTIAVICCLVVFSDAFASQRSSSNEMETSASFSHRTIQISNISVQSVVSSLK